MTKLSYYTSELARLTIYMSIAKAYYYDEFTVVVLDDEVWYLETRYLSNETYNLIIKEMKRLYPSLVHLPDLHK